MDAQRYGSLPDYEIGIVEPRKGIATVRAVAINAVMAGARPEYMPVIIAAVEAALDPRYFFAGVQGTANQGAEMIIVSGPVAKQLDIYSGMGLLGPGWRQNFTIGRAFRLIANNIGGAWPGVNKMAGAIQGGRTGSWVFTENLDQLPRGWNPLQVELGYKRENSTVTLMFLDTPQWTHTHGNPVAGCAPEGFARTMLDSHGVSHYRLNSDVLLILFPNCAQMLAKQGLTKQDIQKRTWELAQEPLSSAESKAYHQFFIKALPEWIQKKSQGSWFRYMRRSLKTLSSPSREGQFRNLDTVYSFPPGVWFKDGDQGDRQVHTQELGAAVEGSPGITIPSVTPDVKD